ncbi:ECF-type sigma factor [Acanthopleuribacter pedis]|uniref:RNA polymerase sigma-70 ECF-like HTH domain-containing protein n=1 Tax=Acanthopleuribacter pedis TaxID=442870 RepID=A0A8J7QKV9_9BACT|nr:ECF-type sigma factor [Acanthopleuribacter pedis]MBO1319840.1 hypothetical protein [Acanthopleuribacter pedis]
MNDPKTQQFLKALADNPPRLDRDDQVDLAEAQQTLGEVTQYLRAWEEADPNALSDLMPLVYQRLKALAYGYLGRSDDRTLQPTALIHEVYLELETREGLHFPSRAEFIAFSGFLMRRVLSRYARERNALKRGGGCVTVALEHDALAGATVGLTPAMLLSLEQAMKQLEQVDPRKCRLIEMRFYAGLDLEEIAALLNVSSRTLKRDWQMAKRFLAVQLKGQDIER